MNKELVTIFSIKQYAIHDGPDIRTTVFLKGCPLSCWWCHNPEGLKQEYDLIINRERCVGCRECVSACDQGALSFIDKQITLDSTRCTLCLSCLEICPALVFEQTGWKATIAEVIQEIEKDIPFFDQSGGGVTFSGGEPLMQAPQLIQLLQECGKLGIHRAVDTSLFAKQDTVLEVARHAELFLVDLKSMDDDKHRLYTGVSNSLILANIQELSASGMEIIIRIPLIPGINDDEKNITASAEFLSQLPGTISVELLPYHSSAKTKYDKLDMMYPGQTIPPSSPAKVKESKATLKRYDIAVLP